MSTILSPFARRKLFVCAKIKEKSFSFSFSLIYWQINPALDLCEFFSYTAAIAGAVVVALLVLFQFSSSAIFAYLNGKFFIYIFMA
jgi:hypothetical protein